MQWIVPSEKETGTGTPEKRLWDAGDQFRANSGVKFQEYSAPVLGLILDPACGSGGMFVQSARFTVESLSPHRVLGVDEDDELIDTLKEGSAEYGAKQSFPQMILENLKTAGMQQAHKEDRITFTALTPWPGEPVCAEGRYVAKDEGRSMKEEVGKEETNTGAKNPKAGNSDLHPSSFPKARSHFHRAGVRHCPARRPRRGRPRGGRCRVRCADRLRLQLQGARHGVQQAGPHPRAQSPHERRPAHGRGP